MIPMYAQFVVVVVFSEKKVEQRDVFWLFCGIQAEKLRWFDFLLKGIRIGNFIGK